jgi:hypothetical protein
MWFNEIQLGFTVHIPVGEESAEGEWLLALVDDHDHGVCGSACAVVSLQIFL